MDQQTVVRRKVLHCRQPNGPVCKWVVDLDDKTDYQIGDIVEVEPRRRYDHAYRYDNAYLPVTAIFSEIKPPEWRVIRKVGQQKDDEVEFDPACC